MISMKIHTKYPFCMSLHCRNTKFSVTKKNVSRFVIFLTTLVSFWVISTDSVIAEGHYYRTGIGLERLSKTEFTDVNCRDNNFAQLYGCGSSTSDGHPYRRSYGDFGTTNVLEFGLGFETDTSLRYEFLLEYRPSYTFTGEANFKRTSLEKQTVTANLSSISGTLAFFIDFNRPGKTGLCHILARVSDWFDTKLEQLH